MGTIDDLLACFDPYDLESICFRNSTGDEGPFPKRKGDLIALIKKYLERGLLDFREDVVSRAKLKGTLMELCIAVGVDESGTMEVLRKRLDTWYRSTEASAPPKPASSRSGVAGFIDGVFAPLPPSPSSGAPRAPSAHAPSLRQIANLPLGDRQMLLVTATKEDPESIGTMLGGFGRALAGAPKVLRVDTSEVASFEFEPGHPQRGKYYVVDPFSPLKYLAAEAAAQEIAEGKMAALAAIAGCLGATRVEVMEVRTEAGETTNSAEIAALGKQLGIIKSGSFRDASGGRLAMEWEQSQIVPIPQEFRRYLDAPGMKDLKAVATLVENNRSPSGIEKEVSLDFRESQEIALKVSKLPGLGVAARHVGNQIFSSQWRFRVSWLAHKVHGQDAPTSGSIASAPGAPCPSCHAALLWIAQYQRWFCRHCGRYAP